jgi:[methyl-Co(III) methanol-specific corrinoid protein]:coenzyme M methyltransferase
VAYRGVLDDVRIALSGGVPERLPVFAMSQVFDALSAGHTFEQAENDKQLLLDCVVHGIETYDWDWAWPVVGDSVTFEPLGFEFGPRLDGRGHDPYIVTSHRPATYETLKQMRVPDLRSEGRMHFVLEALEALKARYGDTVCVTGWVVGPMQCVSYLYGVSDSMLLTYDDPQLLKDTIAFFVDQIVEIADAEIDAGADAIFIPDLLAASYFLSPEQYRTFLLPAHEQVFRHIAERGRPVFFHPNEPSPERLRVMASLGRQCDLALTVGSEADIVVLRDQIGDDACLMGNVHCLGTLRDGNPDSVQAEVEGIVDGVTRRGGHILNTCATMAFDTPAENATAMVETARRYRRGTAG